LPKRVSVLLLAAGSSTRFGGNKMLASFDGGTLVERALATLRRTRADDIVVVLGSYSGKIRTKLIGSGFRVVVNSRFRAGLSTSLRAGLKALGRDTYAVVVVLADQPFVTAELVDELIDRYLEKGCEVVTSSSGGLVSPPVLFASTVFREIEALEGDVGAKSVVMRHSDAERVEVDPDRLLDVDTAEDIERARQLLSRRSRRPRARAREGGGRARVRLSSA